MPSSECPFHWRAIWKSEALSSYHAVTQQLSKLSKLWASAPRTAGEERTAVLLTAGHQAWSASCTSEHRRALLSREHVLPSSEVPAWEPGNTYRRCSKVRPAACPPRMSIGLKAHWLAFAAYRLISSTFGNGSTEQFMLNATVHHAGDVQVFAGRPRLVSA